jgi:hypothetical protein
MVNQTGCNLVRILMERKNTDGKTVVIGSPYINDDEGWMMVCWCLELEAEDLSERHN